MKKYDEIEYVLEDEHYIVLVNLDTEGCAIFAEDKRIDEPPSDHETNKMICDKIFSRELKYVTKHLDEFNSLYKDMSLADRKKSLDANIKKYISSTPHIKDMKTARIRYFSGSKNSVFRAFMAMRNLIRCYVNRDPYSPYKMIPSDSPLLEN